MEFKFQATIHNLRRDQDGQWKVTLAVPQQDGIEVAKLSAMVDMVFEVTCKPQTNYA